MKISSVRPVLRSDLRLYGWMTAYFALLLAIYLTTLSSGYSYQGFVNHFRAENLVIAVACLFLVFFYTRARQTPADLFVSLTALFVTIPSLVLYVGAGLPVFFPAIILFGTSLIAAGSRVLRFPAFRTGIFSLGQLRQVLFVISILMALAVFSLGGRENLNINLAAVYEIREDAALSLPGIFAYLNSATTKVILPFALAIALHQRRWLVCIVLTGISILFFAMTAHKSPLFYPIAVAIIYFLFKKGDTCVNIQKFATFALLVCWIDGALFLTNSEGYFGWLFSLGVRRALMIPALVNWDFIQFFQHGDFIYWAESKLTLGLIQSPFDDRVVRIIGEEFFRNAEMSANTGWIGSGYSNGGLLGVAIYSVLIGAFFALIDAYAVRSDPSLLTATFFLLVFTMLSSSDLLTMLLTHGLLMSIIILISMKKVK